MYHCWTLPISSDMYDYGERYHTAAAPMLDVRWSFLADKGAMITLIPARAVPTFLNHPSSVEVVMFMLREAKREG